ncbi:MAG: hypothetical protein J6T67_01550 [Paludibacteraceae bacterium]|nr:hypothetical protein [Paludibacteraceae bacterium]
MKEKQSNSNKYLTTCIVVLLSLWVMNSCCQSKPISKNPEALDRSAPYVLEFDNQYNWEGVYYGQGDLTDELYDDNPTYSLTINKDSIIFQFQWVADSTPSTSYLFYSKSISPGKIKLLGLKGITDGKRDDILNKDFGVLSIEKEGKKLIWESDFQLLEYNDHSVKKHILYEDKEYDRYVDSMAAVVWGIEE